MRQPPEGHEPRQVFRSFVGPCMQRSILHRVMIAEVAMKYNIGPKHAVRYLKENPRAIGDLEAAWSALENIEQIENLKIAGVGVEVMRLALENSRNYSLLSNDAFHLAAMQKE